MKLHALNCHNCGGLLKVPNHARYVTCAYCGSQLAVRESEGVRYTEEIKEIRERLDELADNNELKLLNEEWAVECKAYLVSSQNGGPRIPTRGGAVTEGFAGVVFLLIWIGLAVWMNMGTVGPGLLFPLFGVVGLVVCIRQAMEAHRKAVTYEQASKRYQQRRDEILQRKRAANERARRKAEEVRQAPADIPPRWKHCDYFGLVPNDDDPWRR